MDGDSQLSPAQIIEPVEFRSAVSERRRRHPIRRLIVPAALLLVAILIVAGAWIGMVWERIEIEVEPDPERVALDGPGPRFMIGDSRLVRPGEYTVSATLEGYRPLEETVTVGRGQDHRFEFRLDPLPGLVTVVVRSGADGPELEGASVFVDGTPLGTTPLPVVEIERGSHTVRVEHGRHRAGEVEIGVEGFHRPERVELVLERDWSEVSVASAPKGAEVRLDGVIVGTTPCAFEARSGRRSVEVAAEGYEPERMELEIVAGQPVALQDIVLRRIRGRLRVETIPPGGLILVGGAYAGAAPVEVEVAPDEGVVVQAALDGYRPAQETVSVGSGVEELVRLELVQEFGIVRLSVQPETAMVRVDGGPPIPVPPEMQLGAVEHTLEFTREGFEPAVRTVRPRPGMPQQITVELAWIPPPKRLVASNGSELVRVDGGSFTMGASRREQGSRSNETLRSVVLERPFYIGVREVTNAEFRAFAADHRPGPVSGVALAADAAPVVGVSWDQAARFCNWLSARDGLPAAYREEDGVMRGVTPPTTGYRLPTEAEWEYVARVDSKGAVRTYPWGDRYPPSGRAGNFADKSAAAIVPGWLEGYDDGFVGPAPVASFDPNPLGVHDMGGNVAEWCQDYYSTYTYNPSEVSIDPMGPERGRHRVVRGSSWRHFSTSTLRGSYRDYSEESRDDLGFRLCRYADEEEAPQ
jgi:formylglycine-generating enzyme required for sulfatase activity